MSHDQETTIADVLRGRMATYQFLSRLFRVEVDQELYDTLVSMRFPTNTGNALVDEGYRMICGYLSQADGTVLTELAVDYVRAFIGFGTVLTAVAVLQVSEEDRPAPPRLISWRSRICRRTPSTWARATRR